MTVEPAWTYWCPAEGTHVIDPNELHVGIVHIDDQGAGHALLVAAIIPPVVRGEQWSQAEAFARTCCDALAAGPWKAPDGFEAGLYADGHGVPFPTTLPPIEPSSDASSTGVPS